MKPFLFLLLFAPVFWSSENEICTAIETKNTEQITQWVNTFFEDNTTHDNDQNHLGQRMAEVTLCAQLLESQACIDSVKIEGIMESMPEQVDLRVFHSHLEPNTYLNIRLLFTRPITATWVNELEKAEAMN